MVDAGRVGGGDAAERDGAEAAARRRDDGLGRDDRGGGRGRGSFDLFGLVEGGDDGLAVFPDARRFLGHEGAEVFAIDGQRDQDAFGLAVGVEGRFDAGEARGGFDEAAFVRGLVFPVGLDLGCGSEGLAAGCAGGGDGGVGDAGACSLLREPRPDACAQAVFFKVLEERHGAEGEEVQGAGRLDEREADFLLRSEELLPRPLHVAGVGHEGRLHHVVRG